MVNELIPGKRNAAETRDAGLRFVNHRNVAHPASVAVYLNDGQAKMTLPDGKANVTSIKAGQVQWTAEGKHLPENVGAKPFELVLVELR